MFALQSDVALQPVTSMLQNLQPAAAPCLHAFLAAQPGSKFRLLPK